MHAFRALALLVVCTAPACGPGAAPEASGGWRYVSLPGTQCRGGGPAGVGLREGTGDLLIVLDGGGRCSDAASCAGNRAGYGAGAFRAQMARRGADGILSPDPGNPVGAWTAAFVPYCTGDFHGGTRPDVAVPGVSGVQQFVGHRNVQAVLDTLASLLPAPRRVLLAGGSAGGLGALLNFDAVARRFPASGVALVSDSGPAFAYGEAFPRRLGTRFEALYGLSGTVPQAALRERGPAALIPYYAEAYPRAALGLSSHADDPAVRRHLGSGGVAVAPEAFAAALADLRAVAPPPWRFYVAPGQGHVFLARSGTYAGDHGSYAEWVQRLVEDAGPLAPEAAGSAGIRGRMGDAGAGAP